jgi:hypothetical protein
MWLLRSLTTAFVLTATAALAQTPSIAPNPQIEIAYEPPANPAFVHIYQRLAARKVLETLAQFLAPLKLDRKLTVKIDQCGAKTRRYDRAQRLATLCYEYIDEVERLAPKSTVVLVQGPVTTDSAIVGPVVQSLLHEVAMAAFDMLAVPVWGRLDDAADRVAAFVMVQFGANVAWNTRSSARPGFSPVPPPTRRIIRMCAARLLSVITRPCASLMDASRSRAIRCGRKTYSNPS